MSLDFLKEIDLVHKSFPQQTVTDYFNKEYKNLKTGFHSSRKAHQLTPCQKLKDKFLRLYPKNFKEKLSKTD